MSPWGRGAALPWAEPPDLDSARRVCSRAQGQPLPVQSRAGQAANRGILLPGTLTLPLPLDLRCLYRREHGKVQAGKAPTLHTITAAHVQIPVLHMFPTPLPGATPEQEPAIAPECC